MKSEKRRSLILLCCSSLIKLTRVLCQLAGHGDLQTTAHHDLRDEKPRKKAVRQLLFKQGFRNDPALVWGWYEWLRMEA